MRTFNYSALFLPSLFAAIACSSPEPEHLTSSLGPVDAGSDPTREERDEDKPDADRPEVTTRPASTSSVDSSKDEGADAGVELDTTEQNSSENQRESVSAPETSSTAGDHTSGGGTASIPPWGSAPLDSSDETAPIGDGSVRWAACGPGKCGSLAVPVSYDDPNGNTIDLRVFVGPATAERRGVVYFNPGGPGEPVVAEQSYEGYYALLNQLMPSMDIVLLDNRGVGESVPTDCIAEDELWAQLADRVVTSDLELFEVLGDFWGGLNDACIETMGETALSNLHTSNVARDMDRVREALGEDKINLWMVSYGTVQASAYAALFPQHVGAFVLDSPAYVGQMTLVDDVEGTVAAYDHELSRFLEWCAREEVCGLGSTVEEVNHNYDALRAELEEGVFVEGVELSRGDFDGPVEVWLRYGEWDEFALILRSLAGGNWGALVHQQGVAADPEAAWRSTQANAIYRLMDFGCPVSFSAENALDVGTLLLARYPRFAESYAFLLSQCVGWYTRPSEQRVITKELPSVPLLIVTSAHDAATPLDGAYTLQSEFNNGSLLYVSQKEGHGVLNSDEPASTAVADYIRTGKMSSFCEQLSCLQSGEARPELNSLRVPTKPVPGLQRLPGLPKLPTLRWPTARVE